MSTDAVLLCGHGSRDPQAVAEFTATAAALRPRLADRDFAIGYLEFARPTIADGLTTLAERGAAHILLLPAMLFAASHVRVDLPREISRFVAARPGVAVQLGRDLAADVNLLAAAEDRIAEAAPRPRNDALLLVVGRGTRDPDANADITMIAERLRDRMGFAGAGTAFGGLAEPRVVDALAAAARSGRHRIVVFPYFLFSGVLVKRIQAETDKAAACFPQIAFVTAGSLGGHPRVVDALAERAVEFATKPHRPDGA
ncbi:MAG TPA: sirohydrochlorin chelatase [Stellaceae bacterium]|jgi:sirohydrochlorin cobaltochelatase|nr:sirohydrochlorin chelatase [Stellaceae bacterium]